MTTIQQQDTLSFHSCGFLILRKKEDQFQMLLMKQRSNWDLPKGKMEKHETPMGGALRELYEETGITENQISIWDGFQYETHYTFHAKRFNGKQVAKTLTIFGAFLIKENQEGIRMTEHAGYSYIPWDPSKKIQEKTIDPLMQYAKDFFKEKSVQEWYQTFEKKKFPLHLSKAPYQVTLPWLDKKSVECYKKEQELLIKATKETQTLAVRLNIAYQACQSRTNTAYAREVLPVPTWMCRWAYKKIASQIFGEPAVALFPTEKNGMTVLFCCEPIRIGKTTLTPGDALMVANGSKHSIPKEKRHHVLHIPYIAKSQQITPTLLSAIYQCGVLPPTLVDGEDAFAMVIDDYPFKQLPCVGFA